MNLKQKIKNNLGTWVYNICFILGVLLGLYIAFWVMIIDPILGCAAAVSAGTVTAKQIIITIFSCIFSGTFGSIITSLFAFVGVVAQTVIEAIVDKI